MKGKRTILTNPVKTNFTAKGAKDAKEKHKKNNDGANRCSRLFFCSSFASFAPFAVATAFSGFGVDQRAYNLTNRLIK